MATGLEEALLVVNVVFLAATVPFSLIAYYGYRNTPWGRVIKWFPLVAGGYLLTQGIVLAEFQGTVPFVLGVGGVVVGVAATALNSTRLALLLTERREV